MSLLALCNTTPFVARFFPALDVHGRDLAVVVVKGTYSFASGGPRIAEEQVPLALGDEHRGEPGSSSLRYESDLCPGKPGTDVVLNGCAYPRGGAAAAVAVELRAGPLVKRVAVVGDRTWVREAGGYRPSPPQRFERMELVYERAFGGRDAGGGDDSERRNPVGVGFLAPGGHTRPDGLPLPNLEQPEAPMRAPTDRPEPAGFGFVHRSWAPRASLAGSFDERWRAERAPLLPLDFDSRHHLAATPGLSSSAPFVGGEPVHATSVLPGGQPLELTLPRVLLEVVLSTRSGESTAVPVLDTVVLEPDEQRLVLVWRAAVPSGRRLLHVERVSVRLRGGS